MSTEQSLSQPHLCLNIRNATLNAKHKVPRQNKDLAVFNDMLWMPSASLIKTTSCS